MLEEVPCQLTDFFKRKNIEPKSFSEDQRDELLQKLASAPRKDKSNSAIIASIVEENSEEE